jgi:hypothetical protein
VSGAVILAARSAVPSILAPPRTVAQHLAVTGLDGGGGALAAVVIAVVSVV